MALEIVGECHVKRAHHFPKIDSQNELAPSFALESLYDFSSGDSLAASLAASDSALLSGKLESKSEGFVSLIKLTSFLSDRLLLLFTDLRTTHN